VGGGPGKRDRVGGYVGKNTSNELNAAGVLGVVGLATIAASYTPYQD